MNMRQLNKIASRVDDLFDSFLNGALWPLLAAGALIVYIAGVMK